MVTYFIIGFAVVFLISGLSRIVEFKAAGLTKNQCRVLIPFHILGSFSFAAALLLLAIDPNQLYKSLMTVCFFGGVLILFPIHIYVNIKRKMRLSK